MHSDLTGQAFHYLTGQAKKWPKMEVFWTVLNKVEPAKQMILNDQKNRWLWGCFLPIFFLFSPYFLVFLFVCLVLLF